jgi:putative addiction module component (TIGR02574 family)
MISKSDLLELDVASRLELIEELWDSIASDPSAASQVPLGEDERELLEQRLEEHRTDPGSARSWQETRAEILKQR